MSSLEIMLHKSDGLVKSCHTRGGGYTCANNYLNRMDSSFHGNPHEPGPTKAYEKRFCHSGLSGIVPCLCDRLRTRRSDRIRSYFRDNYEQTPFQIFC